MSLQALGDIAELEFNLYKALKYCIQALDSNKIEGNKNVRWARKFLKEIEEDIDEI